MRATVDRPGLDSQGRTPLIKIRRIRKGDLTKARDVVEQAFADFFERQLGTRPRQVFGGAQYVHHRWLMEPWGCFVAEEGETKIVGTAVAVMWGTLGLLGPVAVLANYQNQDIGKQLVMACQGFFDENGATLQGLVTSASSAKHLVFYQRFGYRPRGILAIMSKSLERREILQAVKPVRSATTVVRYSALEEAKKKAAMQRLRRISNGIWRGMDLSKEVEIADGLALGDTLLLEKGREIIGFAIYHVPGVSEAPQGSLYVKFAAVDPRHRKVEHLQALLAAAEEIGHQNGLQRVMVPAYTPYWAAYQSSLERGYQIESTMVRMLRGKQLPDEDPAQLVLDDWR